MFTVVMLNYLGNKGNSTKFVYVEYRFKFFPNFFVPSDESVDMTCVGMKS